MTAPLTSLPQSTAPINERAAQVLKYGFRVSALVLAIGIVLTLARGNDIQSNATPLADLVPELLDGNEAAVVTLSIVSMIVTPVFATLVVALGFLRLRERRYARLSFAVLAILAISIIAAFVRQ